MQVLKLLKYIVLYNKIFLMITKETVFPGKLLRSAKVSFKFDKTYKNLKSCLKNRFELVDY